MKILTPRQIRDWDQATIREQWISSADLMERAATACFQWMEDHGYLQRYDRFAVICGNGNNGGDGLVIARLLHERGLRVIVFADRAAEKYSEDYRLNLDRYNRINGHLEDHTHFRPDTPGTNTLVIDALFGSGLNRVVEGTHAELIRRVNASEAKVLAIDLPSGLFHPQAAAEGNHAETNAADPDSASPQSPNAAIIRADHTLTFQTWKYAMLLPSGSDFTGKVTLLDIGLDKAFEVQAETKTYIIDHPLIRRIYKPRSSGSHKGTFGHALLIAGSYGKMGAALMCARAILRTGAGLLTCHVPSSGYQVLQSGIPEAMVITDYNSSFNTRLEDDPGKYKAIAIGPGIGQATETRQLLHDLLLRSKTAMVLDADALNILGTEPDWQRLIPPGSILTPHPKEFARLFGEENDEDGRVRLAVDRAAALGVVIVLKGHHTVVAMPEGTAWFNVTGNAGMAKGGSGDVLTGILTSLLSQGYSSNHAAMLGVWLHGTAGDLAADAFGQESMLATDLVECLGKAFQSI